VTGRLRGPIVQSDAEAAIKRRLTPQRKGPPRRGNADRRGARRKIFDLQASGTRLAQEHFAGKPTCRSVTVEPTSVIADGMRQGVWELKKLQKSPKVSRYPSRFSFYSKPIRLSRFEPA